MSETAAMISPPGFADAALFDWLETAPPEELDQARFGIIGFDAGGVVNLYNAYESGAAGLRPTRVLGRSLFDEVAPCMDNELVADRFAQEPALDVTIAYTLTLRMRPTPVHLRLLQRPGGMRAYVVLLRRGAG